jgi:hypothetical protein
MLRFYKKIQPEALTNSEINRHSPPTVFMINAIAGSQNKLNKGMAICKGQ